MLGTLFALFEEQFQQGKSRETGDPANQPYSCIKNMAKCIKTYGIIEKIEFCTTLLDLTTGELEDLGHFIPLVI